MTLPRARSSAASETMRRSLEKLAEKGGSDPDDVLARVEPVEGIVEAELMIEAVVEDAEVKREIFRQADQLLPAGAILASNTSSIPISSLSTAVTNRPARGIGMHFFNPVPVMQLVESSTVRRPTSRPRAILSSRERWARHAPRPGTSPASSPTAFSCP